LIVFTQIDFIYLAIGTNHIVNLKPFFVDRKFRLFEGATANGVKSLDDLFPFLVGNLSVIRFDDR
jgi:hypothetical protein